MSAKAIGLESNLNGRRATVKMKNRLTALMAIVCGLFAAQALALPFSLGGYTGLVQIKYNNFEVLTVPDACIGAGGLQACSIASPNTGPTGGDNYGIVKVTSILDSLGITTLWSDGAGGAEITGVFSNIGVKTVAVSGANFQIDSIGGVFNLQLNPLGSLAGAGVNTANFDAAKDTYTGITGVAGGQSFLSGIFAPGILASDATITVSGLTNGATLPPRGSSSGYLDVTGGDFMGMFDTNTQNGHDMLLANNFTPNGATGGFGLTSFDPILASVPEPGTVALMGLALAIVGGLALRRRSGEGSLV